MDGQSFSREVAFSQPVINIGAENGNDIVLKGNQVAEFHAMLHYDSSRWYITPLDANFKTSINSRVLDSGGANLQNGSVIEIGGHRLTMMLNGINTDIVIQSPASAEGLTEADMELSGQNILLNVTDMGQTELEAGVSTQLTLEVTNAGPLVANMQLQVQGIPSAWVQIIPPVLNLNEGRKGTFDVRISPPRDSSAEAGLYNLHFVALSPNYPRTTGVADTTLTILPYSEFLVSGPTPRQLKLSRGQKSDVADLTVINNSNAAATFFIHSYDDANELNFAYPKSGGSVVQGQETVRIRAGDNVRVPIEVSAKKVPLIGFANRNHHYMASISPSDRPGDAQTVAGEVVVHPGIHTMWLFVILALIVLGVLFVFQPYIHSFTCIDGRQNQVIIAGNSAWLNWDISRYASTVTLSDGTTSTDITSVGNRYVNPTASTTYTITAENVLSKFLNIQHTQSVQVLVIPQRPSISLFQTDIQDAIFDQPVKLSWSVSGNISTANLTTNNSVQQLTPENLTSSLSQGLQTDTLFSLRAQNNNGYEMKSTFVNVRENRINLNRFTVWVRPNGIAVPSDNDVRRTTRWSSLQLFNTPQDPRVNPQPAAQSNTLEIPDNFTGVSYSSQGSNPELMAVSGQPMPSTGFTYESPAANSSQPELLVSPLLNPTAVPTEVPSPQPVTRTPLIVNSSNVPAASPEGSPSVNRDFSIKLMEVVEDPREDSGYRIIDYFPDYVLQKGEQILVDWNVDGVTQVKIENLSGDNLQNSGSEFIYPEKSITLTLMAESGNNKKVYTLPIRVAGDSDDGEGSGLNCELKANATTLKVPGAVMLTWSGGGTNRVQLVSSTQAEKENEEAEKKKEEEAKAAGQTYTKPTPGPLAGGTIGDWLQPSGFMRVNVDKQTTFMLNAYDGSGNVICTKSVEVKYEGGVDKKNVTLAITRIADSNDVAQPRFAVGQMVTYTVRLTGFEAGKQPTGNIMLTDGTSTCSMTLPVTSCSFQAKKAGALTVTAVYAGDDTYNKTQATARETVIDKLPTTTLIQSAFKPGAALADVVAQLKFDEATSYGLIPTGIITFTIGSGTCDLDVVTEKLTCDGEVETDEKDSYKFLIKKMALADATADRIVASYKGDDYFRPSASTPVLFRKVPTTSVIQASPYKTGESTTNVTSTLSWDGSAFPDYSPTGTITYTIGSGTCVLDLGTDKLSCESASVSMTESEGNYKLDITSMLLADKTADRIKADYSGDSLYNASSSTVVLFEKLPTTTRIYDPMKYENRADLKTALTYDTTKAHSLSPTGTITYTIIRPDPNHKETTCVLTLGANTLSCSGKVNYVTRYEITDMLFEDPESDRVKAVYSGDFFFNSSESPTVLFGEIVEEDIETQLSIASAKKDPDGTIDLNLSLTWDETVAAGAKLGGTIKVTSGTGSCTLNLEASKPAFTDCQAESVTLDGSVYVIKNLQISGAGESIEAAYSGGGRFLPSTATPVYFDRVDTTTTILTAYKTNGNMPTLVTSLSWNTAEAQDEYPLGTLTFRIGTDNCVLTLDNDEAAGKVKSFSCEGSDTVVNDGVLTTEGENSILTWTIERIALSAGNNADRVKASYSGDELFNSSSSKEVVFDTIETEIAISDQTKTPSGLVSLNLDLSWYEEPPVAGMRPTGLITLTSGTKNCTLDISKNPAKFTDCEFEKAVLDTSDPKHSVYKITGLRMGSNSGTDIKAVYSGDGTFLTSTSQTKEFKKLDTQVFIDKAYKPDSLSLADVLHHLTWDETEAEGKTPTGTITLTIGADVCKYDIEDPVRSFNCKGADTTLDFGQTAEAELTGDFRKIVISSTTADRVKVEYSGDNLFNPSSLTTLFVKIDTSISLSNTWKKTITDWYVDFSSALTWDKGQYNKYVCPDESPSCKVPTGTITFTTIKPYNYISTGETQSKCVLDLVTREIDCKNSEQTFEILPDLKMPESIAFAIKQMLTEDQYADRIKAEYSGDSLFNNSVSTMVLFDAGNKINTTLEITDGSKSDNKVTLTAKLTPAENETGTIVFTSGSATCTIDITDHDHIKFEKCSGEAYFVQDPEDPTQIIIDVKDMVMNGMPGDSIYAEYSGDSAYNKSTSPAYSFIRVNTKIAVSKAYKSDSIRAYFNTLFSWDKVKAGEKQPTGTVTFTIGESCKLTIDLVEAANKVKEFSCSDDKTEINLASDTNGKFDWTFEKVLLTAGSTADRVKAEYSGDENFKPSTSEFVLFQTIPTMLDITDQSKSSDGAVNLKATLEWTVDPIEADKVPTGTIKLTMGSNTCTLNIGTPPSISGCKFALGGEVKPNVTVAKTLQYTITGLIMGDGSGDSIKAEYSGDGLFLASASTVKSFDKYDTDLDIEKAYKSGTSYADLNTLLTWNKTEAGDKVPTGTITFTIGGDSCKLTFDGTPDDGHVKDFTCFEKDTTVITPSSVSPVPTPDMKIITWKMVKIMLSSGSTADRVKAEYSGDANFNPSTSDFVLFQTIPTTLKIPNEAKTGSGQLNAELELSWTGDEEPLGPQKTPLGTIKLTMGANTCTLNVSSTQPAFANCNFAEGGKVELDPTVDPTTDKKLKFIITGLVMGDGSGDSIKAEYAGDGLFLASATDEIFFDKYDTELDIEKAYKSGTSYADLNTLLTWNKTEAGTKVPTGTITFTIGGDSCKLTFDGTPDDGNVKDFTCFEKDTTVITPSSVSPVPTPDMKIITWEMLNILLSSGSTADRVKAEYSGDANFNPSTTEFVLFKSIPTEVKIIRMYPDFDPGEFFVILQLSWTEEPSESGRIPTGTINLKVGDKVCPLRLTETEPRIHSDICNVGEISGEPSGKIWELSFRGIEMGEISKNSASTEYLGDNLFRASKYEHKVDTQTDIDRAHIMPDGTVDITFTQQWDQILAGILTDPQDDRNFRPSGTFKITVGASSCTLQMNGIADPVFTDCVARAAKLEYVRTPAHRNIPKFVIEGLKIGDGTAAGIKVEYSGDDLFNASSSNYLYDTVPTTTNLLNQEKSPNGLVSALVELNWTKDPVDESKPQGTIKLTSGSASCTLDLGADPVRFKDCGNLQPVVKKEDKHWTIQIRNLNMGSGVGEDLIAEFSGFVSYLPSASIKKSFTKVNTALVINNAYKPNDPNYANLLSLLSWNNEKAAERVPTGTIKYTVGGGSCELNLSTKKLSCESASDPINMEKIDVDFDTEGYRAAIEKMLLADSSADRVSAEYSGDAVFNPSTASARLFKKLDTTIDIINAYRDKITGRASVYARIDWDEAEDEGLKPTGSLKFNLGSGSCTMDLKTKKLSCVGDTMGTISADGHDYGASNLLLTDTDAKIVSVEYSGDAFFNSSVSQQKLFSGLKTTVAVTSASKGCDGENHCFINLSGTLDWEEDVSIIDLPTGKLIIKVGKKTIEFNMDDQTFTGVVAAGANYTSIANQKSFDPTNRHTFEFTNLLLDDVADVNDITVEYSGDENYGYSTGEGPMSKITIDTKIDLSLHDFSENFQGSGHASWRLRGAITSAYYELPFELTPSGTFTMEGYYEDDIYHDVNRSFFKDDFQLDGPVYDLVNNFEVTLKWVVKPNGRYELKFDSNVSDCDNGDLRWVSIKYNGDDSTKPGQLYNSSNTSYYSANAKNLTLRFQKFSDSSEDKDRVFMDTTGRKYFHMEIEERGTGVYRPSDLTGTWTFVTNSGTCSVKTEKVSSTSASYAYFTFTQEEGECSILYTTYISGGTSTQSYISSAESYQYRVMTMYGLDLGNSSDTFLEIYFNGNDTYKPVHIKSESFTKVATSLSLESKNISNNKLNLTARVNITGAFPTAGSTSIPIAYPAGKFIIRAGDSYTCTVNISKHNPYPEIGAEASLGDDCGGGTVGLNHQFSRYAEIKVDNLPIPDPAVNSVTIEYKGDTIYEPSGPVESSFSRTDTSLALAHTESVPDEIDTTITPTPTEFSYSLGQLTGTVTYTFSPSGTTCTLAVGNSRPKVSVADCDGGSVSDIDYDSSNGKLSFILHKNNISETDMDVSAVYNGDGNYSGSTGSTYLRKYNLTLTPESTGLDTSGRLYFNIQPNVNVYYPKFPERNSYFHCQQKPTDLTNCRKLEHKFDLSVTVNTDPSAPDLTGEELQFEGRIDSDSSLKCRIKPVSSGSGVYSCVLTGIHFTAPGEYKISVMYPGSEHFNKVPATEFPATFYAVSVASSELTETTTVINTPETLTAGTKVLVKADTFNAADPNDKPGEQFHLFYTYNFSTKERIETCLETAAAPDCELNLTTDTDWVYAEFVGYGTYAPSVASKRVDGASSGNALGAPVSFSGIEIGGGG